MKEYLRVKTGPFHILLDATCILEIIELEEPQTTQSVEESAEERVSEHISWREQVLKLIDWQDILAIQTQFDIHFHVVYQLCETTRPIVYAINEIIGLLHLEQSDFLALPPLPEKLDQLFDKAYFDKQQQVQVLCLRSTISLATIESYLNDKSSRQAFAFPTVNEAKDVQK